MIKTDRQTNTQTMLCQHRHQGCQVSGNEPDSPEIKETARKKVDTLPDYVINDLTLALVLVKKAKESYSALTTTASTISDDCKLHVRNATNYPPT